MKTYFPIKTENKTEQFSTKQQQSDDDEMIVKWNCTGTQRKIPQFLFVLRRRRFLNRGGGQELGFASFLIWAIVLTYLSHTIHCIYLKNIQFNATSAAILKIPSEIRYFVQIWERSMSTGNKFYYFELFWVGFTYKFLFWFLFFLGVENFFSRYSSLYSFN